MSSSKIQRPQARRLTSNLVNLSDAWRRHARFTKQDAADSLSKLSRRLLVQLTYYRGEPAEQGMNKHLEDNITETISDIAKVAKQAGLPKIILPFMDHKDNPMAQWVKAAVLAKADFPVDIEFLDKPYKTDLSNLGRIDARKQTLLDEGIRGIADIDDDIKVKWAMQRRHG